MVNKVLRVVSLVPSWTETLLCCGVPVVGRTRFCIHPSQQVKTIPAVGGTKEADWEKIAQLNPDLVLLDKEENTLEMAQACPLSWLATHVKGIRDMPPELEGLAANLGSLELENLSKRWQRVLLDVKESPSLQDLPGVIKWLRPPVGPIQNVFYVIWRNPWMLATQSTFIGSVLSHLLGPELLFQSSEKYPKVDLSSFDKSQNLFLFSSEPYPFAKYSDELLSQFQNSSLALVDGESFSWFGIRSLKFLENGLK